MIDMPKVLAELRQGPVEMTLRQLLSEAGLEQSPLQGPRIVTEYLQVHQIIVEPALGIGMDAVHTLRPPALPEWLTAYDKELVTGEHSGQEFKESLLFDVGRAANDPNATAKDLRNEALLDECLKTVCAFLNTDGGLLWVGVNDKTGKCRGLLDDLGILGYKGDDWQDRLHLWIRSQVRDRFYDGNAVNSFVDVRFPVVDGHHAIRLHVSKRVRKLSAFRDRKNVWRSYCRQGASSPELTMTTVEEFVLQRSGCN
ncbi:helix-turn-helix domain-containing protein [Euzebya rosea]|uniref:AlbA family DNA-binding domain-containing protein n=1 Tax=Euzebya rosea TaxID=2052804 RepID=UPI000D3E6728|nr:ATP-binding protein [Euzebya rosea]